MKLSWILPTYSWMILLVHQLYAILSIQKLRNGIARLSKDPLMKSYKIEHKKNIPCSWSVLHTPSLLTIQKVVSEANTRSKSNRITLQGHETLGQKLVFLPSLNFVSTRLCLWKDVIANSLASGIGILLSWIFLKLFCLCFKSFYEPLIWPVLRVLRWLVKLNGNQMHSLAQLQ